MNDIEALTRLNEQFIEAFRRGSWELLEPVLSPSFSYLDGRSGEVWAHERYVENLESNPSPALAIDQVVVHGRWGRGDRVGPNVAAARALRPLRRHVRALG